MDGVIDIRSRKRGPIDPPHIDAASWRMLVETLVGLLELCIREGDSGRPNSELERLTQQLQRLTERFTPPKGAA